MSNFAIYTPKMGEREDVPSIQLPEAYIADESENIIERYGEYRRVRGRVIELVDDDGVKIDAPRYVYAVTGVDQGNKKFTISGNHATTINANLDNSQIRINASTGNDALYTASDVSDSGGNTVITVTEALTDATVDGNVFVGVTPVIRHHYHKAEGTGVEYPLIGTAYHILLWNHTAKTLAVKYTCSSPSSVERWEMASFRNNVYATNNSDFVLWWKLSTADSGTPSNDFVNLDDDEADGLGGNDLGLAIDETGGSKIYITKAKHLFSIDDRLWVGYLTLNDGNVYPQRGQWCSLGDSLDWDAITGSGDAGFREFTDTPDYLAGFARYGNELIVAKAEHMWRGWSVEADTVYEWAEETLKVGCLSADTLVNDKAGRLYWLASDLTIRELTTPFPLSGPIDKTMKQLNTGQLEFAQAAYIDEINMIAFAVAVGSSTTNNKLLVFNPDKATWQPPWDFPVRAFGRYTQQTVYTYQTLPYDTYAAWGLDWIIYDTSVNVVGFPLILVSDYEGATFTLLRGELDDGDEYNGKLVMATDLSKDNSLGFFKRLNNGIDLTFNRESSGSVDVYVKRNGENTWQSVGSVALTDSASPDWVTPHLPCNIRAKHFKFELVGASPFEFIGAGFYDFIGNDGLV